MKFEYLKLKQSLTLNDEEPEIRHVFHMEGHGFRIVASKEGVMLMGETNWFLPVDEERKIPEYFREFMVRLDSAFELAWQERMKVEKQAKARAMILGAK